MGIKSERAFLSRIIFIHEQLIAGARVTARALSEQYEVHHRTILRDIKYMRDDLELPIEYDRKKRSLCYAQYPGRFARMETLQDFQDRLNKK